MMLKIKNLRKNWPLFLLTFFFICLLIGLGFWQLSRATEKKILLKSFEERMKKTPLHTHDLVKKPYNYLINLKFYRITLGGFFDNSHTFLLDNKTFHGKIGYEIVTPFKADNMPVMLLIDRGFIPSTDRKNLPRIEEIQGKVTLTGMLNTPPSYVALGQMEESGERSWPLRIEFVNLSLLSQLLHRPLFPLIVIMDPRDPKAYALEWNILTMGPEKHIGYAVQWFALALALLILFIVFNRRN